MDRRTKIGASIAAGATAVVAVAAIAVASPNATRAADGTTPSPSSSTAPKGSDTHVQETPLTGSDADRAKAAALEAVPGGTVLRVETDSDGGATYEAHVRRSDGTEVVVTMDDSFNVTSVDEFAGRRSGRGRGPGPHETALTGTQAEKATATAQAAVEGGTVLRVETDSDGGATYEAHVRRGDGTEVVVKMDDSFNVTSVDEFAGHGGAGRGGNHGHGPRGGDADGPNGNQDGSTSTTTPST